MQDFLDVPFETENEEATPPFVLIPRDRYTAEIVSAKAGATKNGKGYSVSLNWSITEGDYENRTVFQNILIQHESAEAQKYGRQKFKDVLNALGIKETVTDLSVMLHKPCLIGVNIRQDKSGQYPDRNEIGRVMPILVSHNGPTRDALKEAQKAQAAFKPMHNDLNDDIPY
jgi:hypothetical protein